MKNEEQLNTPPVVEQTPLEESNVPAKKKTPAKPVVKNETPPDEDEEEQEEGISIGQSEEQFFKRKDLLEKKARIYVEIPEERGYDENGEEIVMYPAKPIEVQPYYWDAILRDKKTGKPQKKQKLVGYKIEENGQMKHYKFKE